jgi:peptide/nickel transport system permease protein
MDRGQEGLGEPLGPETFLLPPEGERGDDLAPSTLPEVGTEDRGDVRPSRGVGLSLLLPGLPQLLAGQIWLGGALIILWGGLLATVVGRWERVWGAWRGPLDHQVALLALVMALAGVWALSLQHLRRGEAQVGSRRQWTRFWRSFASNRLALIGAGAVVGVCLGALLAPFLAPYDPATQGNLLTHRLAGPSGEHLLGTDQYARDILSRLLYGARISLAIGLIAVAIAVTIGTVLGALAGYLGGRIDSIIMRLVDMVISFPRLVLLITVMALFRPSIFIIVVILGLTQWPQVARIVRAEVLSLREREFIQAGVALGYSRRRILFRHILPNALAPVTVAATLGIGDTIILEAVLSFLGLGIQPPTASWGIMVADGRSNLLGAWWVTTFPGLAIVLVVLSFNLVGDGLRDALDPRLRR